MFCFSRYYVMNVLTKLLNIIQNVACVNCFNSAVFLIALIVLSFNCFNSAVFLIALSAVVLSALIVLSF